MVWSIAVQGPFVLARTNRCQGEFRQGTSSWHLAHSEDHIAPRLVREFLFCKRCLESEKKTIWKQGEFLWSIPDGTAVERIEFEYFRWEAPESPLAQRHPNRPSSRLVDLSSEQFHKLQFGQVSQTITTFRKLFFLYQRYSDIVSTAS